MNAQRIMNAPPASVITIPAANQDAVNYRQYSYQWEDGVVIKQKILPVFFIVLDLPTELRVIKRAIMPQRIFNASGEFV